MRIRSTAAPPGLEFVRDDGSGVTLHPLWLRERCEDPASMDARTRQRLYDPADLDPNLRITALAELNPGCWRLEFSDGAIATFSAERLDAEICGTLDSLPVPQPWSASLAPLPRIRWAAHPAPADLLYLLEAFVRYGFVILSGVPSEPGSVLAVARTFGFVRETNFGALFDVRSVPEATDLAYTPLSLDPHTDNPYRNPVPGVQLLHCLVNESTGGRSTLVDGLAVVEALRAADPAAHRILATTPVRFVYTDAHTELAEHAPMIELDQRGRFAAIRHSPRLDFVPLAPPAELAAFYAARRTLDLMLRSRVYQVEFRLDDGDLMMVDNRRLLHGRTAFDPRQGLRHLQGCYIDMDGILSACRVLHRRLRLNELAA